MQRSSTTTISSANPSSVRQSASWRFFVMGDDERGKQRTCVRSPPVASRRLARHPSATAAMPPPPPPRPTGCPSTCRWSGDRSRERTSPRAGPRCARPAVQRPHGAYCSTGLGPNRPRVGTPEAAATCISPVSLPMNKATAAAPPPRSTDRSCRRDRSMRAGGRRSSSGSACARSWAAASTATRAPGNGPSAAVSRRASSAKRSPRHCLPRQFAAGPIASTGPPGLAAALGLRARARGASPEPRARRRIEVEQAGELAHAMLARIALGRRPGVRRRAAARQRRAAQIDDKIPAPSRHGRDKAPANAAASAAFPPRSGVPAPAPPRTAAPRPGRRRSSAGRPDGARSGARAARSTARHRRCASRLQTGCACRASDIPALLRLAKPRACQGHGRSLTLTR